MARVSRKKQNLPAPAVDTPIRRWKTALYVRLSVEDNGKGSDSIENQTTLLEDYIASRSYLEKTALFVDNGYTGTDFLRPEFNRMMEAVKMGIVDCIVVKDLSRLGRNYIETSQFIEKVCPFFDLRFISVNDSFDTATVTSEGHLSASLSNIVNDFYAKDISRKVTTALQAKMERGDYIGNYAPYGYRKDPENKNHLLIDPETAPIVVQIFQWRAEGVSYMGINKKLNDAGILSPSQLKRERGVETNFNKKDRVILWNKHMITEILQNIVYIGHLAQKKGSQCLYGGIPYHITSEDEWIIAKNTHEPLLSEELFEKVQEIRQQRHRMIRTGRSSIFSGLVYCADCGFKMLYGSSNNGDLDQDFFDCSLHRKHKEKCNGHFIRVKVLERLVLKHIQAVMGYILRHEDYFRTIMEEQLRMESYEQIRIRRKRLESNERRIAELKRLFIKIYEDNASGRLTDERYDMLSQTYEAEQKQLEVEAITLQQEIEVQERQNENIEKFIQKAHKYVGIEELDGYALRELVSAIYVDAPDKSSGKRVQHIHIKYDGLGFIPLNELMKKETA